MNINIVVSIVILIVWLGVIGFLLQDAPVAVMFLVNTFFLGLMAFFFQRYKKSKK